MFFSQRLELQQTMSLSMQQALNILQLPAYALQEYLIDISMDNPMVDFNQLNEPHPVSLTECTEEWDRFPGYRGQNGQDTNWENQQAPYAASDTAQQETFISHLTQQLPQVSKYLPERYIPICKFIIESLDSRGYLDEPIDMLAAAANVSIEDFMQALYAVQALSPTGVGARSLEECLVLQLADGPYFNRWTLAIVRNFLPELAQKDFGLIAKKLSITKRKAEEYSRAICFLNPIPSNGFRTGRDENHYVIPEAYVDIQRDQISVQYNRTAVPNLVVNPEYTALLKSTQDPATEKYLKEKQAQIYRIQQDLSKRETTIVRLIRCMLQVQKAYLTGQDPAPSVLTVQDLAETMGLNPSTVSRGIKDKYISISGQLVPLKNLLCAQIGKGIPFSRAMLKVCMTKLIDSEDKEHPLSDESLQEALGTMGISISRRSVAQYRKLFDFPTAAKRKKT